jgi:hypothetical protein
VITQSELKTIALDCAAKINDSPDKSLFDEKPFKHVVIDDFFPENFAHACIQNFPLTGSNNWEFTDDSDIEVKYRTTWKSEFDIPEGIINAVRILNSSLILRAMANIFPIKKILPDPYFTGGGLNVTKPNGLLDVHIDGNYHDATGLNRRLNAILYLNPNWQKGWGGEFGLYDEKGDKCLKKVAPLFNRLVIFDTHDKSFHGLPNPLNFPAGEERRSIILYYYTKEERVLEHNIINQPHSALWKKRDLLDKRGNKIREGS